MTEAALRARRLAGQRRFYDLVASGSDGARRVDLPGGVQATVCPARGDRSLFNAVVYEDPAALVAALPELPEVYAGIDAWTVWVLPGDEVAAPALEAAGHVLDGTPREMAALLAEMDLAPRAELELVEADWWTLAEINEDAYVASLGGRYMGVVSERWAPDAGHPHVAALDGRPSACVLVLDVEGDAYVTMVATRKDAQGRGLCSELLRSALREAARRGATTTSLEATAMGAPVYARLGYADLGTMQMWERRNLADSA